MDETNEKRTMGQRLQNLSKKQIALIFFAALIIIGVAVFLANPKKILMDRRNAQRRSDVSLILNALHQYSVDNNGTLPSADSIPVVPAAPKEICASNQDCKDGVKLNELVSSKKYISSIPRDPSLPSSDLAGSGYYVVKTENNRVTVSAPNAENGARISATR